MAEADLPLAHTVAAARLWAANEFPYLASALFALSVHGVDGLDAIVVDQWWRVHADPEVAAAAEPRALGGELVHLVTHLLRDHASRAQVVGLSEAEEVHHWVDAADAEVNDDVPSDLPRLRHRVDPEELGCETGRLAEEYYRRGLPREGECNDCGSGAHGRTAGFEPPPPSEGGGGLDNDQQDLLRQRVADEVSRTQADVPDGLRRWAKEHQQPTVDWRAVLGAEIRRSIGFVAGAVDYSYARPSRRAAALHEVVLPSLRRPEVSVAVVCDTSASVDDRLLGTALAEVEGLLRAAGSRGVRVLACDDSVRAVSDVRRVDDIELFGGGGTDMAIGLDAAVDHRPRPQVVVVLTDGFTPWPVESPPSTRVVAALLESDTGGLPVPEPPEWARTVWVAQP